MKSMRTIAALVAVIGMSSFAQAGLRGRGECGASKCCDCAPTFQPTCCKPTIVRPCHRNVYNYQRSCAKATGCDACGGPANSCCPTGAGNGCGTGCTDGAGNGCVNGANNCAAPCGTGTGCVNGANTCAAPCATGNGCANGAGNCAAPCGTGAGCTAGANNCAAPCGNGCAADAGCAAPCGAGCAADAGCAAPCGTGCAADAGNCAAPCGAGNACCNTDPGCAAPCGGTCCATTCQDACEIAQLIYESQTACYARQRRAALQKLGRRYDCVCNPEIMSAFIYGLNDSDERVRETAADKIGDELRKNSCCCSQCTVEALTVALADCDRGVRRQAEQALRQCGYDVVDPSCCEVACDTGCVGNGCGTGCAPAVAPAMAPAAAPNAPAPPAEPKAYFPKRISDENARPVSASKKSLSNLFGLAR